MEDRYSWLPSACKVQAFDTFPYSASDAANEVTVIANKLALKKRVYDAADWKGFRSAVNAYKSYGDYLIIKK